ncbi:MAG: S46 family peptidase [Myxococcota bacterium]
MSRLLLLVLVVSAPAFADEGMWLFNDFPSQKVKERYGFSPSQPWLDHLRLSSARLARGCSASFVSPQGLVLTNHHCVSSCVEQLSTAKKDLLQAGFFAKELSSELRCPAAEVNQLVDISDVTGKVHAATQGLADAKFTEAEKAVIATLEKECATSDELRCDVVNLYRGGKYHLYKYRRFQDVRLVFAPEMAIAFFGGDPDNFNFPRYDGDFAFLRIYENGKPARIEHYLKWSSQGAQPGEVAFVSGHPGGTNRLLTVAQLEWERDVVFPQTLTYLAELRGYLTQFQTKSPEHRRISSTTLFYIENGYKARRGRHQALLDKQFFASKAEAEKALRAKVSADPQLQKAYGSAWEVTASALQRYRTFRDEHQMIEETRGFSSQLFAIARTLVRASAELPKPNPERLKEFADARLPALKQQLFSPAPIYDELEIATLTFSLTKLREALSPDHPVVKKVLGKQTPAELAAAWVKGSKLKDVKLRRALFEGGAKAVEASKDPMILLAKTIDAEGRALRQRFEAEVEGPLKKAGEQIAKARFHLYGTSTYPDATFTLRLSYGQVTGWKEKDKEVPPLTTLAGAFERHTGKEPFALPSSWLKAQKTLDLATPMNFVTTNDIIGGNSGSPVVNKEGELIGLVFDGNIHSLGGDFGFEEAKNRAVSVHSSLILEALEKVYGAKRLVEELRPVALGAVKSGTK